MSTKREKQLRDLCDAVDKANSKPKAKPTPKTGIDKIIAHLIKHKDQIGAIVVGVAPKPCAQVTAPDSDKCEGLCLSADVTTFNEHENDYRHSLLIRGLVAHLVNAHLDRRGPLG